MKKVLLVTHEYPGPGGGRMPKLAKHLPSLGYEPVILTARRRMIRPDNDSTNGTRIVRVPCLHKSPFRLFSKVFNSWALTRYFESLVFVPDMFLTMLPAAVMEGERLIEKEGIDLVFTSSPPESMHLIGLLLKRRTHVKWIADFQDLWTTKKIVYKPPTSLHDSITRRLERRILDECDHIIANTWGNERIYRELFAIPGQKITVIPCGYDKEEKRLASSCSVDADHSDCHRHAEFTIGYMGFFDKDGFPWKDLLLSIRSFSEMHGNAMVRLNICGHVSRGAQTFIETSGLSRYVRYMGNLPHAQAFEATSKCDLLALLMYETPYSRAIVPHKLYYYLAMAKPVLAIAEKDGEVAEIIRRTGVGKTVPLRERALIPGLLSDYYEEWQRRGFISSSPNQAEIGLYEYSRLARLLKETMDESLAISPPKIEMMT